MKKEEKKVPQLRFPEFTGDWEQRKLSELSDFITKGATPTTYGYDWQESGIPFFRNDAIKDNQFIYGDFSYISEEANEALQRSEIHGDDILVAITGDIGKAGIVPKSIEKGNINQHTARVRIIKDAIPYFVYQSLITDKQQKKYQLIKTGLSMPQLSLQQIRDTIVLCPSVEEQSMIGECFINLDNLITLHQRKLEKIKELKKGMLQKMFPKNGKKVPEIRFKGFTDDWEQRKVTELLKSSSSAMKIGPFGSALKKEYFVEEGIKVYAQENAFTGDFSMGDYYITEDKYKELKSCELYPGDLVISMMGTVGACAIFPKNAEKGIMNSHLLRLQFNNEVIPEYIMYLLRDSVLIRKQIDRLSVGSIMSGLSSSVVKKLVFPIPKLAEQKRIVEYLGSIDHLITLHQRKLEKIKELKKGLLQQMFV